MRYLTVLAVCLVLASAAWSAPARTRVLMLIPDDFMWPEYKLPLDHYRAAGFEVVTAGRFAGQVKPDRRNAKDYPASGPVTVDLTFDTVDVSQFDALTCVAGNGAWHDFFPNETVHKLVKTALARNKIVGLLCASTGLLGLIDNVDGNGPGIAQGKQVVGYFRVAGILTKLGHVKLIPGGVKEPGVAVDGRLVTGRNPESADAFGRKIVEILSTR